MEVKDLFGIAFSVDNVSGTLFCSGESGEAMQDHCFGSKDASLPYFYIFDRGDDRVNGREPAFYRYDTMPEAAALFRYMQVAHPDREFSLGIHKDFSRRADIVVRSGGANVLSDDFVRTSPWKSDPALPELAKDAAERLEVEWMVDRELAGRPVLVPYEGAKARLSPFFKDKALCPDDSGNPLSSIQEVCLEGEGWVPFVELEKLSGSGRNDVGVYPKVVSLLVRYQVDESGFRGSTSMFPAEFRIMRERYEEGRLGRAPQLEKGPIPLDELKFQAGKRAVDRNSGSRKARDSKLREGAR